MKKRLKPFVFIIGLILITVIGNGYYLNSKSETEDSHSASEEPVHSNPISTKDEIAENHEGPETGTIIHIDAAHANIGRLFNLYQVQKSLDGATIQPGQILSFNKTIELSRSRYKFMESYALTDEGVFVAGGVCGAASALAGEVDRISNDLVRRDDGGRHPVSYHQEGGLYWNLPNIAVFFDGQVHRDLFVENKSPQATYQIKVKSNFENIWEKIGVDLENWQVSNSRWNEFLDPEQYTEEGEFQLEILIGKIPEQEI